MSSMYANVQQTLTFPAPTGPTMAIIRACGPQLKEVFFKVSLPPFFACIEIRAQSNV